MSRQYVAVSPAIRSRPKFHNLSVAGRAALLTVWTDAATRDPEATWPSRQELADVLDMDGLPVETLDELIAGRWIDLLDDGRPIVHDWDEWQVAYSIGAQRAWEAARKAEWRRRRAVSDPSPTPPPGGKVRIGKGSPGHVPDMSGTRTGSNNGATDPEAVATILSDLRATWSNPRAGADQAGTDRTPATSDLIPTDGPGPCPECGRPLAPVPGKHPVCTNAPGHVAPPDACQTGKEMS